MMKKSQLIEFENKVKELWENGELPYLIHLCGGNENELIEIFKGIKKDDYVFSTHRSHYHYLLKGGTDLLDKIKRGDSMFVFNRELNFISSSIVAGTPCIAAGVSYALKLKKSVNRVWCFVGDGATDQGNFYEAVRFVEKNKLPCVFIIEDNDRSVDTPKSMRLGDVDLWKDFHCVRYYSYQPTYPHAGSGCNFKITFK